MSASYTAGPYANETDTILKHFLNISESLLSAVLFWFCFTCRHLTVLFQFSVGCVDNFAEK